MKKSNKFWTTIAIVSVLAAVSVVGVIIGVLFHTEETFLPTCLPGEEGNELFTSIHDDHCPVIGWEDNAFPLCVRFADSSLPISDAHAVWRAIDAVNEEFGRKIFLPAWGDECDNEVQFYVSIFLRRPHERHWFEKAGHVTFRRERWDGRLRATIYIGNTSHEGVLRYALMHEFGHVLFLKHDEYQSSIMFREVGDPLFLSTPGSVLQVQHFSDSDVKAVLERYPNLPPL